MATTGVAAAASASACARTAARVPNFSLGEWPVFLVPPSRVYASMDALDPRWGLPFSRPMPMPDAWEGMVMANAERAVAIAAAVRPTRATRRPSAGVAEATTDLRAICALAAGALATTRVWTRDWDMADILCVCCVYVCVGGAGDGGTRSVEGRR